MYHASQHHSHSPAVNSVVILGVSEVELRSLIVGRCHFGIILLGREVILAEAEINKPQFLALMVDQDVEWLDVSVHDSVGMDVV